MRKAEDGRLGKVVAPGTCAAEPHGISKIRPSVTREHFLAVLRVDDRGIAAGIHNERYAFPAAKQRQFDESLNVGHGRKGPRPPSHQMLRAEETSNGQDCALGFGTFRTTVSALIHSGKSS